MFKGPHETVRNNKSSTYPVFELPGVNCRLFEEQQKLANVDLGYHISLHNVPLFFRFSCFRIFSLECLSLLFQNNI